MRVLMCLIPLLAWALIGCADAVERRVDSGNALYDDGDYAPALRQYQAAQVIAPDRSLAYFNAAAAYDALDDPEAAISALEQVIRTGDDDVTADAYYNLGNIYYRTRRYDEAVSAYQASLRDNPTDEDARYNLELAMMRVFTPTSTAQEQQTNPESGETDPETTPTDQPRGFDGPTPSPPPLDFDRSATPVDGESDTGAEDSATPIPRSEGDMSVEQAEELLDRIQQDQQALSEYLEQAGAPGAPSEKDW